MQQGKSTDTDIKRLSVQTVKTLLSVKAVVTEVEKTSVNSESKVNTAFHLQRSRGLHFHFVGSRPKLRKEVLAKPRVRQSSARQLATQVDTQRGLFDSPFWRAGGSSVAQSSNFRLVAQSVAQSSCSDTVTANSQSTPVGGSKRGPTVLYDEIYSNGD